MKLLATIAPDRTQRIASQALRMQPDDRGPAVALADLDQQVFLALAYRGTRLRRNHRKWSAIAPSRVVSTCGRWAIAYTVTVIQTGCHQPVGHGKAHRVTPSRPGGSLLAHANTLARDSLRPGVTRGVVRPVFSIPATYSGNSTRLEIIPISPDPIPSRSDRARRRGDRPGGSRGHRTPAGRQRTNSFCGKQFARRQAS